MPTLANRTTLVSALITAGVLLGAGFLVVGGKPADTHVRTTGGTTPAPVPGTQALQTSPGPEGVTVVTGPALGPARSPTPGRSLGGVPCGSSEQFTYHVHARLTLFVNGKARAVPLGVGIAPPRKISGTGLDRFVASGRCFSFLHTHASDGVIHIEAPGPIDFRLRQFFAVWQQRLDRSHLGPYSGRVIAFVNGRRYNGDPREILLRRHTQIQLELGQPIRAPLTIEFPANL